MPARRGYCGSVGLPSRPWQAAQVPALVAPALTSPHTTVSGALTSGAVSTGALSGIGVIVVWA